MDVPKAADDGRLCGSGCAPTAARRRRTRLRASTGVTLLLAHVGRRLLAVGTMLLSGAFCLTVGVMGGGMRWMEVERMACRVVGILSIAATYNLLLVYKAEVFPPAVRNAAPGCVQQAEQVGEVVAPMVVVLGSGAPLMVFGACAIVCGLLSFMLPETRDQALFDTMAGMEAAERKKSKVVA